MEIKYESDSKCFGVTYNHKGSLYIKGSNDLIDKHIANYECRKNEITQWAICDKCGTAFLIEN